MSIRPPIKEIGKSTSIYGFGNILTKLAIFFLIPIYTRYLTIVEVGILALLEMVEMFLTTIVPLGINAALWRYLSEYDPQNHKKLILSAFLGTLIVDLLILSVIALSYQYFSHFLGLYGHNSQLFLLLVLNVFLGISFRFILGLWQYQGKAIQFVLLSFAQFLGVLFFTIFFVVYRELGLLGALISKSVVFGFIFLITGVAIVLTNKTRPSFSLYWKLIKFGIPLIVLGIVTPVLTFSDRFFMRFFLSLEEIGVYSIAYKFGMIINMILVIPLQKGWAPMMYRLGIEEESHEYHRDILFYYAVIGSVIFLTFSFFARPVLGFVASDKYIEGASVIPVITLAYFFNGFRQFFMAGAALKNKTPRLAYIAMIVMVVNMALNYILIKYYGVMGAAWATFFSYITLIYLVYQSSQRLVKIDWKWKRLVKLILSTLGIFLLVSFLQIVFVNWAYFWAIVGICFFPVLLWTTKTFGHRELSGLKTLINMVSTRNK